MPIEIRRNYAVIGRIQGDDEDTCKVFHNLTFQQATVWFVEWMIKERNLRDEADPNSDDYKEPEVDIRFVLGSDEAIQIAYGLNSRSQTLLKDGPKEELTAAERLKLAEEVFEIVFNETETFGEGDIGVHLAYLLGAIVRAPDPAEPSFCEWVEEWKLARILREKCSATHPVWQFIRFVPSEDELSVV